MFGKVINSSGYKMSEQPSGEKDEENTLFNTSKIPIASSFSLYLNGLCLTADEDFILNGDTITMSYAPFSDDDLLCCYTY